MLKQFLKHIQHDVRSTTGKNLRSILLLTGKTSITDLKKQDANCIQYHPLKDEDTWKVDCIRELVDVKNCQLRVDNFASEELSQILHYLTVE